MTVQRRSDMTPSRLGSLQFQWSAYRFEPTLNSRDIDSDDTSAEPAYLMSDEPTRNSGLRAGSHRPNPPPIPAKPAAQSAALRGATLAFKAQTAAKPAAEKPVKNTRDVGRIAQLNERSNRLENGEEETREGGGWAQDAAGIVEDRIKRFTEAPGSIVPQTLSSRDAGALRPGTANPQQIAAQLAVGRSTARTSVPLSPAKEENRRSRSLGPKLGSDSVDSDTASNTSSNAINSRSSRGEDDSIATASDLEMDNHRHITDPRGRPVVNARRPIASLRKDHTGASLPPSPLSREITRPRPIEPERGHSSLQNRSRPPLPPRTPTATVNKLDPFPRAISTGDDSIVTKSTSARTATPSATVPPSHTMSSPSSRASLRPQHSGMSDHSLADAVAASSLASSRAPSPSKKSVPPPPPPHRRSRSRSFLNPKHPSAQRDPSRTPSPPKGMRQTMRQDPKSDDEAERLKKYHRSRIIKTHPNKHREGDRKRWRDQVTERERKRYEGVWAANRGLLMPYTREAGTMSGTSPQDMVLDLVVRDIWSRSRLPSQVLGQIWELVGQGNDRRMLSREEFVVGMWLIDQSLKGRKLPVKVSQSVWDSVQLISGIHSASSQR
ncbi:hypothetical protein FQN55_001130 [Onygenales sp. PD_40]|nr:hypothetical protein FQN55_001130 [Onygenales sp. PD_40]